MQRPTERLRELVEDMDSAAIVAHVVPYYHGWQVEGEWLDDWRDAVMAECDRLDRECKAHVWRDCDRLDERCREVRDGA